MRSIISIMMLFAFMGLSCGDCLPREIPARDVPAPETAGEELKKSIDDGLLDIWKLSPKNAAEWQALVNERAAMAAKINQGLLERLGVSCREASIAGVPVFILEPPSIPAGHKDKILLYFHGGGYVFNPGMAGLGEGIYMAHFGKYKVIAVDYRLAPDFPFPTAIEDAMAVYRYLLKSYAPQDIGVFGSSTGGAMTLVLCQLAMKEGLPLPGAIAPGTPWADLSKTGDSYFANDQIDNVLVAYEGLLEGMANAYAGGRDFRDPLISPVYGDFEGFPPAILGTGTRDLFLSNAVRTHRKMREAGVEADLLVIEGLSHYQYVFLPPEAPETRYYFTEVAKFFDKHLGKRD